MKNKISNITIPDFLAIGFCCHDLVDGKNILGGAASYSSLAAKNFGKKTAVLTSVGKDFQFFDLFEKEGIDFYNKEASKTTVFENIYREGKRRQYLHARANTLFPSDLPSHLAKAPLVLFSTIADDLDFKLLSAFPNALKGAIIQGWLRQWDENGNVSPKDFDWKKLKGIDVVIMSEDDIQNIEKAIQEIIKNVPTVVVTKGKNGASIYTKKEHLHFSSFPSKEVDPTGAGDIFAASFLMHYNQTKDLALAAAFAHSAASLIIEAIGLQIPNLEEVKLRFKKYKNLYF